MPEGPPLQEWKAYSFYHAFRGYASIPRVIRRGLRLFLFEISPDVPVSLTSAWRQASLGAVFTIAATLTFIMSFVVVYGWSAIAGTLYGTDPARLYFLQDWVNLLNYALLCPLYVGFGAVLIATTVQGWAKLNDLTVQDTDPKRTTYRSTFLLALLALCFAFFTNSRFMAENMNPAIYPHLYWFMDHTRPDGSRVIGAFGFYYGFLNFCLMSFSIMVAATFISQFRLLIQIGESLDRLASNQTVSTELLRARLTSFTQSYVAGKLAIAAYMANALAWKTSQSKHSATLVLYGIALTFFGVVFLSIPRYYVELLWLHARTAQHTATEPSPEYEDLRALQVPFVRGSWPARVVAGWMDAILIGGFILNFW